MIQTGCRASSIPAAQRHRRCSAGVHVSAIVSVGTLHTGRSRQQLAAPCFRWTQPAAAQPDRLAYNSDDADVPPEQAEWLQQESPAAASPGAESVAAAVDGGDGDAAADSTSLSTPESAESGQVTALGLLRSTWTMLRGRLLAVLVLMSLQDAAIFACQRLADFVTNHAAVMWLGGAYTREALGPMSWATQDPALSTFSGGYVWLHWLFQGAALPTKIAVQAAATAALFHLATSEPRSGQGRNPLRRLANAVADALTALRSGLSDWRRAYLATALVLFRFLPLGAASILIVPLYWTLPRVVKLQAAVPAAIAEGLGPKAAVERSRQLVGGQVRAFGVPLLLLTLAPRAALTGRHWLLAALPPRLWTQVQELPLLIAYGTPLLAIVLFRMQELLPVAAYKAAVAAEGSSRQLRTDDQLDVDTAAGSTNVESPQPEA